MNLIKSVVDVDFKEFSGGDCFSVLIGRHDQHFASDKYTVAIVKLPIGGRSEEHFHHVAEESYFVVSGRGEVVIDGETAEVIKNSLVFARPNQKHYFKNLGNEELVYLVITAPKWTPEDSFTI